MNRAAIVSVVLVSVACASAPPPPTTTIVESEEVVVRLRVRDDLAPIALEEAEEPEPICDGSGPDGLAVLDVAGGYAHMCAALSDGRVRCWGLNNAGQLGDGGYDNASTPTPVRDVAGATAVGAGRMHACALTSNGSVYCWGSNDYGQLGAGSRGHGVGPRAQKARLRAVAQLSVGWDHSCAVTKRGQVHCWGRNHHGQLGDGTRELRATPTAVRALRASYVSAGHETSCAVALDGRVACWGALSMSERPRFVEGLPAPAISVEVGTATACARLADGSVWCWGDGMHGLLGAVQGASERPIRVGGLPPALSLRVRGHRACVVGGENELWCWGSTQPVYGGDASPIRIGAMSAAEGVGMTASAACARTARGGLCCWGSNQSGLLGRDFGPFQRPARSTEQPIPLPW